jgi:CHAT domain-containing protein
LKITRSQWITIKIVEIINGAIVMKLPTINKKSLPFLWALLCLLPLSVNAQISAPPGNGNNPGSPTVGDLLPLSPPFNVNTNRTPNVSSSPGVKNPDPDLTRVFGNLQQFNSNINLEKAQIILQDILSNTGVKPAIIYTVFSPPNLAVLDIAKDRNNVSEQALNNFQLELIMVTPTGAPIRKAIPITREKLLELAQQFREELTKGRDTQLFLPTAQQLHKLLIDPLIADLKTQKIQNLVFIMDGGLRSLPVAALHDGKQFLVESYSVGLMPSLSLTDTRYVDVRKTQLLAMGAEKTPNQKSLLAAPIELETISTKIWQGKSFKDNQILKDNQFTVSNLVTQREKQPFAIVHLATHGKFKSGAPSNSYIQFANERLELDRFRELKLNNRPIELLVLSACETALGDENAELGFAGLANRTGAKSAMGSLWSVDDAGTLGLITSFYRRLIKAPIKAEALRQTQVDMLRGKVRLEGGKLITANDRIDLPAKLAGKNVKLTHPFYWAGFTIVGNPW